MIKKKKPVKAKKAAKTATKAKTKPRKKGRPRTINRAPIQKELCLLIAHSNKSIYSCLEELRKTLGKKVPTLRTIFEWLKTDDDFIHQYAHAKEEQAEYLVEEMLAIADDDSEDTIFVEADDKSGKSAKRVCNNEFVQRSRLRVDTRKWIASKLKPKKFGEKLEVETPDGKPLIMITSAASPLPKDDNDGK